MGKLNVQSVLYICTLDMTDKASTILLTSKAKEIVYNSAASDSTATDFFCKLLVLIISFYVVVVFLVFTALPQL